MSLRFVEDRRTLVWAFGLFPLVPALAFIRPSLLPWLLPFAIYSAYCSGVLSHNHNHCPMFVKRALNTAYGAWLSLFYGFPIFAWVPTHNQNHHRYVNGEGDATRTSSHSERDTFWALLSYPFASSRAQLPAVWAYGLDAFRHRPARFRRILVESGFALFGQLGLWGLAVALHGLGLGSLVYWATLGAPALLAPYFMMLTNYLQHVGCDAASPDNHSRNFVRPTLNWLVFDNGLHTVHHDRPGEHWSRLRALHDERAARIDPRLNQGSLLGYVVRHYFASPVWQRVKARTGVRAPLRAQARPPLTLS